MTGHLGFFTVWILAWIAAARGSSLLVNKTLDKYLRMEDRARILNVFQIVRFPNGPCSSTTGFRNGTCYTSEECTDRGGSSVSTCASGFGVCCMFTLGCGDSTSENSTYFDSGENVSGSCSITVCRAASNICQMRLDFETFIIAGPSTSTVAVGNVNRGIATNTGGVSVSTASSCQTDTFQVSGGSGNPTPIICGTNSGKHMYIDVADNMNCIQLNFLIQTTGKSWSIRTNQYECDYENLAPAGCTEFYFTGQTGTISSYNYDGGQHLARQRHSICVRRHENFCRICYYANAKTDFVLSGTVSTAKGRVQGCCGYGGNGIRTSGYDCIFIPNAEKDTGTGASVREEFCGRSQGLVTSAATTTSKTICTTLLPFHILFLSDSYEFTGTTAGGKKRESNSLDKGFKLQFFQDTTNCP